jgi:hypothetical protein
MNECRRERDGGERWSEGGLRQEQRGEEMEGAGMEGQRGRVRYRDAERQQRPQLCVCVGLFLLALFRVFVFVLFLAVVT